MEETLKHDVNMNKWTCDKAGCTNIAIGVGPATGLMAIGWNVIVSDNRPPVLICPAHEHYNNSRTMALKENISYCVNELTKMIE